MILRLALSLFLATASAECEAGARRRCLRIEKQKTRQIEAQTGVATLKWQTRLNRAVALKNFSAPFGWFNPLAWVFGGLL